MDLRFTSNDTELGWYLPFGVRWIVIDLQIFDHFVDVPSWLQLSERQILFFWPDELVASICVLLMVICSGLRREYSHTKLVLLTGHHVSYNENPLKFD